jgi:hypothetical protein
MSAFQSPSFLEVFDQKLVDDHKVAGHVGLNVDVFVDRLDGWVAAGNVGGRGGRRVGHGVGVAHAPLRTASRTSASRASRGEARLCACRALLKERKRVLREDAAVPLRAFVGLVGAALFGQQRRGEDRVVGDTSMLSSLKRTASSESKLMPSL